jgi:hypothetical protein
VALLTAYYWVRQDLKRNRWQSVKNKLNDSDNNYSPIKEKPEHYLISDFDNNGFISSATKLSRNTKVFFQLQGLTKSIKEILQSFLFLFDVFTDFKFLFWFRGILIENKTSKNGTLDQESLNKYNLIIAILALPIIIPISIELFGAMCGKTPV